ncbi:OLC1v1000056C1 [Oldenlandia corymbosa var. corymbosa]|uniref:OLC1v1000056C1 n=1 Tax=Oldenlandia corymbosa var. corymbosa TaxID=529605 RepID=A0AAV1D2A0_OLDCO|nr:OLC1v1000056C1 [Oldenlandia corymbosa var. corymbosa]
MAELLISKIIDGLSDVLLKQVEERVNLVAGVEVEVQNLSSKLTKLENLLGDAARRRLQEKNVSIWLEALEGITHEMEDVLDEWNIKIVRPQELDQQGGGSSSTVSSILRKVPPSFSQMLPPEYRRPMTTSIFDESEVHGRDPDKHSLIKHMVFEVKGDNSGCFRGRVRHLLLIGMKTSTSVSIIPDIGKALDVSWCKRLKYLPPRIGDLVHLRHLHNDGTLKLLNQLEELQVDVHGSDVDFENALLENKIYLYKLTLRFEMRHGYDSENESLVEMIKLKPPPILQELQLYDYPATQLPEWIVAQPLVNNLRSLALLGAKVSSFPSLWKLSSLESLTFGFLPNIKHIGPEFCGLVDDLSVEDSCEGATSSLVAFPSLRRLSFISFWSWETWEDISEEDEENMENGRISILPRLQHLEIFGVDELKALPHRVLRRTSLLKT